MGSSSTREAELRRMRDAFRIRIHLAGRKTQDRFYELEGAWLRLERADPREAEGLLDEIERGYERMRRRERPA